MLDAAAVFVLLFSLFTIWALAVVFLAVVRGEFSPPGTFDPVLGINRNTDETGKD